MPFPRKWYGIRNKTHHNKLLFTSQTIIILKLIRIQTHNSASFLPVGTQILQSSFKTWPSPSPPPIHPPPPLKEIRPNLPYSVPRGLKTGLAMPKALHIIKPYFCTVFKLFENDPFLNLLEKNQEFVPQVLKQVGNLSCYLLIYLAVRTTILERNKTDSDQFHVL